MDTKQSLQIAHDRLALLGDPVAEFAARGWRSFRNLIMVPVLILLFAAIKVTVFFWKDPLGQAFINLVIGILLTLAGLALAVRAYRNHGLRVLVFPEGIVRLDRAGAEVLLWDEIYEVRRKSLRENLNAAWRGALIFSVQRSDGKTINFDDSLPHLEELGELLLQGTLPHLLPHALRAYEAGQTLDFGRLRVSRLGISQRKEILAWSDVQEVKLEKDEVTIHRKARWTHWFQSGIEDIPNFHVLRELVRHALAEQNSPMRRS